MNFRGIHFFILFMAAGFFLAGCEELHPFESVSYYTPVTNIISEPPGATIQLDGKTVGQAPTQIIWSMEDTKMHAIRAIPIYTGHCVQRVFIYGRGGWSASQSTRAYGKKGKLIRPGLKTPTPGEIVFNMADCSQETAKDEGEK